MKKLLTILSVSLAFVAFTTTASAQGAATKESAKPSFTNNKAETVSDLKSQENEKAAAKKEAVAKKETPENAAKREQKQQANAAEMNKKIETYERKIEARKNDPNFDLKAAEAELARMKKEAAGK